MPLDAIVANCNQHKSLFLFVFLILLAKHLFYASYPSIHQKYDYSIWCIQIIIGKPKSHGIQHCRKSNAMNHNALDLRLHASSQ